MLNAKYVPIEHFPDKEKTKDPYSMFYGHDDDHEELQKYAKKMKGVKVIQKRL